ncbi:hypothetical protein OS493_032640 [Desmophyllum pertusum]|uniref:Glutathione synthetase n=1 Tax=Desmophyllum pertusum TaxID=174260 RepID=A0A9X0CE60_9CNID|nr:hypothetical protein OS493_032640 [Desmophyllum pertusum]
MARLPDVSEHEFSQDEVKYLEREGKDYCIAHGLVHKDSKGESELIPFTLFPSPFPWKLFTATREVQMDFNLLVHKVSQDYEFIKNALLSTVTADPFTSRLFDIYEKVWEQGNAQPISLGFFRSDYLIEATGGLHEKCSSGISNNNTVDKDVDPPYIKQVELNTISLGGISFSQHVTNMHSYNSCSLVSNPGKLKKDRYLLHLMGRPESKVPSNPALDEAADGLIKAWELYGSTSAVVMLVVQPNEFNVYCQRMVEYRVKERNNGIRVIRRSLTDVFNDGKTDNDKALFVNGLEVAVAYFRAGYTPRDYPTENEWSARLTLELSRCIKCPTVAHQLMGTKKMQQVFANPGVLERYRYVCLQPKARSINLPKKELRLHPQHTEMFPFIIFPPTAPDRDGERSWRCVVERSGDYGYLPTLISTRYD